VERHLQFQKYATFFQFQNKLTSATCHSALGSYSTVTLKGVKEPDKRQKESPPTKSRGSEQTTLLSEFLLRERSLGMAGSTPSPRLGQRFMSKGLSV